MPRTSNLTSFYLGPDVQVGGRQGLSACVEQVLAHHWMHFTFLGFTSVLRPSVSSTGDDVRPMALQCWRFDSDGSPPGCLIIGSTGQEVIHVYERWHNISVIHPHGAS